MIEEEAREAKEIIHFREVCEQWFRYRSEIALLLDRKDIAENNIRDYFSETTLKEIEARDRHEGIELD